MNRGCSWDLAQQHLQDFAAGRASDGQAESQHAGFYIEQNKSFGKTGATSRCTGSAGHPAQAEPHMAMTVLCGKPHGEAHPWQLQAGLPATPFNQAAWGCVGWCPTWPQCCALPAAARALTSVPTCRPPQGAGGDRHHSSRKCAPGRWTLPRHAAQQHHRAPHRHPRAAQPLQEGGCPCRRHQAPVAAWSGAVPWLQSELSLLWVLAHWVVDAGCIRAETARSGGCLRRPRSEPCRSSSRSYSASGYAGHRSCCQEALGLLVRLAPEEVWARRRMQDVCPWSLPLPEHDCSSFNGCRLREQWWLTDTDIGARSAVGLSVHWR